MCVCLNVCVCVRVCAWACVRVRGCVCVCAIVRYGVLMPRVHIAVYSASQKRGTPHPKVTPPTTSTWIVKSSCADYWGISQAIEGGPGDD